MNGSLFGTIKVIKSFWNLMDCNRTNHSLFSRLGMFLYWMYQVWTIFLSFMSVGSIYMFMSIFVSQHLSEVVHANYEYLFQYLYLILILLTIIVSFGGVLDHSLFILKVIMVFFGLLLWASIVAILVYLVSTSFSQLTVCSIIMLGIYLVPLILHFLDFLQNYCLVDP